MTHQPSPNGITARRLVEARREIGCFLDPSLFSDPVYDILLSLLAAEDDGISVEMSDGVRFANVPATTALRCIKVLKMRGLITRSYDSTNDCRCSLMLTAECRTALRAYIEQVSLTLGN